MKRLASFVITIVIIAVTPSKKKNSCIMSNYHIFVYFLKFPSKKIEYLGEKVEFLGSASLPREQNEFLYSADPPSAKKNEFRGPTDLPCVIREFLVSTDFQSEKIVTYCHMHRSL